MNKTGATKFRIGDIYEEITKDHNDSEMMNLSWIWQLKVGPRIMVESVLG